MKHFNLFFIITLLFSFGIMNAQKTAYMSSKEVLNSIPAFGKNQETVDSLKTAYTEELERREKNWEEKMKSLLAKNDIVVENEINIDVIQPQLEGPDLERFELYLEENKMIESAKENYNMTLQNKYNQLVNPIIKRIKDAISSYSNKNDIEVVYDIDILGQGTLYVDKKLYITEDIIEMLKD